MKLSSSKQQRHTPPILGNAARTGSLAQSSAVPQCRGPSGHSIQSRLTTITANKAPLSSLSLKQSTSISHGYAHPPNRRVFSTSQGGGSGVDGHKVSPGQPTSSPHFTSVLGDDRSRFIADNIGDIRNRVPPSPHDNSMHIHIPTYDAHEEGFGHTMDSNDGATMGGTGFNITPPTSKPGGRSSFGTRNEKLTIDIDENQKVSSKPPIELTDMHQSYRKEGSAFIEKNPVKEIPKITTNVGTVGRLDDDIVEKTFSRTLFYGFGPDHIVLNGMGFQGSVIALPNMLFLWKPRKWSDVTAESLAILNFLYPQPDMIIFGCGATGQAIDTSAHHYLKTLNIPYELMSTPSAIGTFNLLNEEFRKVACFAIALDEDEHQDFEVLKTKDVMKK